MIGKRGESRGLLTQVGICGCDVTIVLLLAGGPKKCTLNVFDRGENFGMLQITFVWLSFVMRDLAISPDGLLCQCREQRAWEGCRSSHGVGAGE